VVFARPLGTVDGRSVATGSLSTLGTFRYPDDSHARGVAFLNMKYLHMNGSLPWPRKGEPYLSREL
jgi:hypothetical protein